MRAYVIANANAGLLRKNPDFGSALGRICGSRARLCITSDSGELDEVARDVAAREDAQVAILGGDGTAGVTLTALWRAHGERPLPRIALVRGGTMNTIANSLRVSRQRPLELVTRALDAWSYHRDSYFYRPVMRIGERLGFLCGTGLMYGYLAEYYEAGQGSPTPQIAAEVLAKAALSAAVNGPTYQRILSRAVLGVRFDGGEWESREYITVGAGTVAHAGLGFRPFHLAFDSTQRFHLLAIHGSPLSVITDMPAIWLGRGMRPTTAHQTTASWAELKSESGPFGYFVDGDLARSDGILKLAIGPVFAILRI